MNNSFGSSSPQKQGKVTLPQSPNEQENPLRINTEITENASENGFSPTRQKPTSSFYLAAKKLDNEVTESADADGDASPDSPDPTRYRSVADTPISKYQLPVQREIALNNINLRLNGEDSYRDASPDTPIGYKPISDQTMLRKGLSMQHEMAINNINLSEARRNRGQLNTADTEAYGPDRSSKKLGIYIGRCKLWILLIVLLVLTIWLSGFSIWFILHLRKDNKIEKHVFVSSFEPRCLSDFDCAGQMTNKVCETTANICVECLFSDECATQTTNKVCDARAHTCVQCLASNDCSGRAINKVCDSTAQTCVQCLADTDCSGQATNKVCDTLASHTCVQCVTNKDCSGQATDTLCDTNQNKCIAPCTPATCSSRTDGKTKCCGTECIDECQAGFACDILGSECVAKLGSALQGNNVPNNPGFGSCGHCHSTSISITGSMFRKSQLNNFDYLTALEYIFVQGGPQPTLNMADVTIWYVPAPNCLQNDYSTNPKIYIDSFASVTAAKVDFTNIVPIQSECFFVVTQATFGSDISCDANGFVANQVVVYKGSSTPDYLGHTPYYQLYGF